MKLRSILLIPRRKGRFHLDEAEAYWGEPPEFYMEKVEAVRPGEGVGVLLVFRPSRLDEDLGVFAWFPSLRELESLQRALEESDLRTFRLLGHGWGGVRPFNPMEAESYGDCAIIRI